MVLTKRSGASGDENALKADIWVIPGLVPLLRIMNALVLMIWQLIYEDEDCHLTLGQAFQKMATVKIGFANSDAQY